jgi:hypothetical protein
MILKNPRVIDFANKGLRQWPLIGFALAIFGFGVRWFCLVPAIADKAHPPTLETLVPEGFQLIPIEVANAESLDSVFGNFGYVDLYASGFHSPNPSARIAQAVKLLRAPLNPRQFAVLIRSEDASRIVQQGPTFFVVVQNLQNPGTFVDSKPLKALSRIVYEGVGR